MCEQLAKLRQTGRRRILLCGTGELAEITFLTIQEMGLEFVGVVAESPDREQFLGYPVKQIGEVSPADYDWLVVTSARWEQGNGVVQRLIALGVPADRIITLDQSGMPVAAWAEGSAVKMAGPVLPAVEPMPAPEPLERVS